MTEMTLQMTYLPATRRWPPCLRQWRGGVELLRLSSGYPVLPTDVGPASSHHMGLGDAAYEMRDEMGCGEGLLGY